MRVIGRTPWGEIAAGDLAAAGVGHVALSDDVDLGDRVDLVIAAAPADDRLILERIARAAHAAAIPSLFASFDGLYALVGPAVFPGRTACWACAERRMIACAARAAAAEALAGALRDHRAEPRERLYPAAAAGVLGHMTASAAIDLLISGAGSDLAGRIAARSLVDLETTYHAVIPTPSCPVCGGAQAVAARPPVSLAAARTPAEVRRALAGIVDARAGIVKALVVASQDSPHGVDLPVTATAVLGAYGGCVDHDHPPEDGSGKGLSAARAMIGAVGEAVERYSARWFDPARIRRVAEEAIAEDHLPLRRLNLYAAEQYADPDFPHPRVDRSAPLDWVEGRWLDTGKAVLCPALLTYYGYPAPPGESFCQVTSNGLAAGATSEDAAFRAALELIERDAFTLSWLARRPGLRVDLDASVDAGVRDLARQFAAEAGEGGRSALYLLDVGIGIPTVLSVVFGDGRRWPGASVSIAAHPSPRVALAKALLEQGQGGPYYRRLLEEGGPVPARPEDVFTLEDHARYYFPRERASAFAFLDAGGSAPASSLEEPREISLAALAARVRAAGMRIAVVDVTAPDLRGTPFRVARALGPDFQQIHFGHALARRDNPRLQALAPRGLNPDPHPLD